MIDWTPLIVAGAALLYALATAIPTVVVMLQHNTTRAAVADNSRTLDRVEHQTNGTLEATKAGLAALEVRLANVEAAARARRLPP